MKELDDLKQIGEEATPEQLVKGLRLATNMAEPFLMETMLELGADPHYVDPAAQSHIVLAASNGFREGIRILLNADVDPDMPESQKQPRSALCAAAWKNQPDAAVDLLRAGADLHGRPTWDQHMERSAGWQRYEEMEAVYQAWDKLPKVNDAVFEGLTNAKLFARDPETGYALADNPRLWRFADRVFRALEQSHETLSLDAMMQPGNWDGNRSVFEHLVECRQMGALVNYLVHHDDMLDPLTLLDDAKRGTPLLSFICDHGGTRHLFDEEIWAGYSPHDLRDFKNALPESAQADIPNLHVLNAILSRNSHRASLVVGG